jgi:hypothetical protein
MRCVFQFYKQRQPEKQEREEADFSMGKYHRAMKRLGSAFSSAEHCPDRRPRQEG